MEAKKDSRKRFKWAHRLAFNSQIGVWLTTFNDLMTLLLVFFVMLFSMSTPDYRKLTHFRTALQSTLGVLHTGSTSDLDVLVEDVSSHLAQRPDHGDQQSDDHISEKMQLIQNLAAHLNSQSQIEAIHTDQGLLITLRDQMLFSTGSADLNRGGHRLLERIGTELKKIEDPIRIEGHTDNVPIQTDRYKSNWELSIARAVQVLKFLMNKSGLKPERLSAVGYGEVKPLVGNTSPGNRKLNRRVEIMLELQEET